MDANAFDLLNDHQKLLLSNKYEKFKASQYYETILIYAAEVEQLTDQIIREGGVVASTSADGLSVSFNTALESPLQLARERLNNLLELASEELQMKNKTSFYIFKNYF